MRIIYNKPIVEQTSRTLQRFESEVALREELIADVSAGKRCFVTCNSKRTVNVLSKIIRERCGSKIKLRSVTSDNSRDASEIDFVRNICDEILEVQVLLCSPSLGTGVDLTFPDPSGVSLAGLRKIDAVYGFFHAKVNTHTDMDQQLCRVRNPGAVKVRISPARFQFSSNFDVIRDDLARARFAPRAVQGYSADGLTQYDPHHPMLMIMTHITASQRASKNNLVERFCELRRSQGWTIEVNGTSIKGNKDRSHAERKLWQEHAYGLASAPMLDDDEYLDLCIRRSNGEPFSLEDRLVYERNVMQRALGVELTYDIIKLNHDGLLLSKVETLSSLMRDWSIFWRIASTIKGSLEQPLARLAKARDRELLAVILVVAGIAGEDGINPDVRVDLAGLGKFAQLCQRNQTHLEEVLGQPVRKDVATNPIRQLNAFLKLGGLKLDALLREKHQRKSVRLYGFETGKFEEMSALARVFQSPEAELERLRALRN